MPSTRSRFGLVGATPSRGVLVTIRTSRAAGSRWVRSARSRAFPNLIRAIGRTNHSIMLAAMLLEVCFPAVDTGWGHGLVIARHGRSHPPYYGIMKVLQAFQPDWLSPVRLERLTYGSVVPGQGHAGSGFSCRQSRKESTSSDRPGCTVRRIVKESHFYNPTSDIVTQDWPNANGTAFSGLSDRVAPATKCVIRGIASRRGSVREPSRACQGSNHECRGVRPESAAKCRSGCPAGRGTVGSDGVGQESRTDADGSGRTARRA